MERDPRVFLWDARDAAEAISRYTRGKTYDEYLGDDILRDAVERRFQIVGEALAQLSRLAPALAEQIPDIAKIVAFRNVLVHGYRDIEHDEVWRTVKDDLPALIGQLDGLLGDK